MSLRIDDPVWLVVLLLALPAVLIGLRWFTSMSVARRLSAVLLRVGLIALLVLALAGLTGVRESARLAVIAVVDVSDSVRQMGSATATPAEMDALLSSFVRQASDGRDAEDLLGIVAFDGESTVIRTASAGSDAFRTVGTNTSGTSIESGIRLAAAMIPADASARLLLLTDGNETVGSVMRAASELVELRGQRIPIDVVPIEYEVAGEVVVNSLDVPPVAATDVPVMARVTLNSTGPVDGTLYLEREGRFVDLNGDAEGSGRRIRLPGGTWVETFPLRLASSRINRFRAVFEPDDPAMDRIGSNNSAEAFTLTPASGGVLFVDGVGGSAPPVVGVLREASLTVDVVDPEGVPTDVLPLQAYDLVVLNDVAADAMDPASQQALVSHVTEFGAGLVVIGGASSYGAGGWRGSELEPVLPVHLDLPDELVLPRAAIVIVLDTSGSMGRSVMGSTRSQQTVANEGAALAIRSLDRRDLVGVITFDRGFRVAVPLAVNKEPAKTADRVRGISSGGGTNLPPALLEAKRQLEGVRAEVKHVIVLSDGESEGMEQLPGIAGAMLEQGITVSTIGVGDQAESTTLQAMAAAGGGEFYPVRNPNLLPRLFVRAVRVVRMPLVREVPFDPVLTGSVSPVMEGVGQPPRLGGLTLTRIRTDPTVTTVMRSPEGEPVLAHWSAGLGRVVAFTSDGGSGERPWAEAWLPWAGFERFWTQVARYAARPAGDGAGELVTRVSGEELQLRLDATDDEGLALNDLTVEAKVYGPDGGRETVTLTQTGPGAYEALVPARGAGNYVVVATPRLGDQVLAPVLGGASRSGGAEFRSLRSDGALVRRVAAATGGRVFDLSAPPTASVLFDRSEVRAREARQSLWHLVLTSALIVLMLDIATRRVAWDRLLSAEFGAAARRDARAALGDRSGGAVRTVSSLREASARGDEARDAAAIDTLGTEDALRIVRERAGGDAVTDRDAGDDEGSSATTEGLFAAKRRARQEMDEQGEA